MKIRDLIGWLGVLLILCAFTLTTFGIINSTNPFYGILNFLGALGIIVSSYFKRDFQPVLLNVIWLIVAAIGFFRSIT